MSEIVSLCDRTRGPIRLSVRSLIVLTLLSTTCWRFEVPHRAIVGGAPVAPGARAIDDETIASPRHLSRGYPAREPDGSVNAVIEIPSGTTAKFEVDDADGWLRWALRREDRVRREIDYLPFVVNYGMIPGTLAEDGDPLDVIVLGRGIERAHVAATRVIGVLKMAHDGTRDDKLVAVPLEPALRNGFSRLHELAELDLGYPEARHILVLWFSSYWGAGNTTVIGWGDAAEAIAILDEAIARVTPSALAYSGRPGSADPRPRAASPSVALAR
jgi:inorganic pyrophosphatase